jgi:hypothetical protein
MHEILCQHILAGYLVALVELCPLSQHPCPKETVLSKFTFAAALLQEKLFEVPDVQVEDCVFDRLLLMWLSLLL